MTVHDRALELAAAAIDFPLAPSERHELDEHLATCPACRRSVAALRTDATAVLSPVAPLPEARAQVILAGALRRRRSGPPIRMLAIAALFAVGAGAALAVGAQLLDDSPTETPPIVVRPSETPGPSAPPSPSDGLATPTPSVPPSPPIAEPTPSTSASASPPPVVAGPIRADARQIGTGIGIAAGADGSAFVAVPGGGETVLYRLDPDGGVSNGWPLLLPAPSCAPPLAVPDGSVRVVCPGEPEGELGLLESQRAFAFDGAGQALPGWPVEVPCCVEAFFFAGFDARMDGTTLVFVASRVTTDVEAPELPIGVSQIVTVTSEGSVTAGEQIPRLSDQAATAIGPQQTGYSIRVDGQRSEITAFDMGGLRSGWPIELDPVVSAPTFLPDGRIAFTVAPLGSESATIRFVGADGRSFGSSQAIEFQPSTPWTGAGEVLLAPMLVADNGTLRVVGGDSGPDAGIWALDGSGSVLDGWPWIAEPGLEYEGFCGEGDTGCGQMRVAPAVGPEGQVVVAIKATDTGGALVAVDANGQVVEGWPVTLNREGSAFWSVVTGETGVTYALAIEPEDGGGFSGTILAIDPDSTVRWATTLVEP